MKEVNRYTSNEFHDWQRKRLPGHFVLQDLDTWVLVWADGSATAEPFALVELKRSYVAPSDWSPYEADKPNYLALFRLARKAGLPLWIIYFQKGKPIEDDTLFHIFLVEDIGEGRPWIKCKEKVLSAKEFAESFPRIF